MSERAPVVAPPEIMGFTVTVLGRIPRIENFNPANRPNGRVWAVMLERLRDSGDSTSVTTHQGRNHPCQTENLRCDHQNQLGDFVNTQCQVGGHTTYKRGKYNNNNESTTVSHVEVHAACYNSANIRNALALCHDYSFSTGNTVRIAPSAVVGAGHQAQTPVTTFICGRCQAEVTAVDAIELGLRYNSYPPACSFTTGSCKNARGEGGFTRKR